MTSVAKLVAEAWKNLSPEERHIWEEKAKLDKRRYELEKATYDGPLRVKVRRSKKDPSAPKKPMSAYLSFANRKRSSIRLMHPTATNAEISKILAAMWREVPQEIRQPYIDEEARLRDTYKVEIAAWRSQKNQKKTQQADMKATEVVQSILALTQTLQPISYTESGLVDLTERSLMDESGGASPMTSSLMDNGSLSNPMQGTAPCLQPTFLCGEPSTFESSASPLCLAPEIRQNVQLTPSTPYDAEGTSLSQFSKSFSCMQPPANQVPAGNSLAGTCWGTEFVQNATSKEASFTSTTLPSSDLSCFVDGMKMTTERNHCGSKDGKESALGRFLDEALRMDDDLAFVDVIADDTTTTREETGNTTSNDDNPIEDLLEDLVTGLWEDNNANTAWEPEADFRCIT